MEADLELMKKLGDEVQRKVEMLTARIDGLYAKINDIERMLKREIENNGDNIRHELKREIDYLRRGY